MLILGKPKDLSNYIVVNSKASYFLHSKGFFPKYRDGENFYYIKTSNIEEVLKKGGV